MTLDQGDRWAAHSRELAFSCDAQGKITWADARAVRLLGAQPEVLFSTLAVAGTEGKIRALLDRAQSEDVKNWEVALVASRSPCTVCISSQRDPSGSVHFHGFVLPEGSADTVRQLSEALGDVVSLNREISRQKKELAAKNEELTRAYQELEESNKGVLNLHAELADKAASLRRAADVKAAWWPT